MSATNPNGLPLLATASSDKNVRVYSLRDFGLHSMLEGGHERSVRSCAWKPVAREEDKAGDKGTQDSADQNDVLVLATGSFDATMGIWRRDEKATQTRITSMTDAYAQLEVEIGRDGQPKATKAAATNHSEDWDFVVVLEGHDSEIKTVAYSPSGQWLASCSRDKSIWIWEEIGAAGDDEFETVAVLQEHEGDVKCVAWRRDDGNGEVLASGAYDDTVRLWREDGEGEWESFATLEGHTGTVWSLAWEPAVSVGGDARIGDDASMAALLRTPRLLSASADGTIRLWAAGEYTPPANKPSYFSVVPNRMRRAVAETWTCTATLPVVHNLPVYAVAWSAYSGRVASVGGDGRIVVYAESGDEEAVNIGGAAERKWHVVATREAGHGAYEINHVTWSMRFDSGRHGTEEEMIVTTGDDGLVRAWRVDG